MFKANLIESPKYYNYRRKGFIYFILGMLPIGIWVNYDFIPLWATILSIMIYAGLLILSVKNLKKMKSITENSRIEMDDHMIRIKSISQDRNYEMDLNKAEKISIPKDYGMPDESILVPDEVSFHPKKNFIELSIGAQKVKFDFIIDSHYMLVQFEKLIQTWTNKGYSVELV